MMDRTGNQLGNYRMIRLLGKGGFADVYLGEHIYLQTQAAIKILHTRLTPENMNNFLSEAKTIARLAHPHIVRVLDFGVDNDTPFLVMEYAPNNTLRQRHPQGTRLSLPTIVSYVKQIASALQYAHDQRLIHRDVKPENMLLGRNYEVLLSDFGIATISQTSRSLPTLEVSGTISYMAPEQIQGKPRPASDQYSLGIIIYEWLTGACPFKGSFSEIATQHMFTAPPSLRVAYPLLSPDVERVVMVALSKNPEERFARVEAFAFALEQAYQIELPTLPGSNPSPLFPSSLSPTVVAAPARDPLPPVSPVNTGPHHLPPPDLYVPIPGAQQAYHVPSPVTPIPPVLANSTTSGDMPALKPQRKVPRRAFMGGAVLLAVAAASGVAWTKLSPVLFPSSASSTGNSSDSAPTRPATSGTATQSTPASQSSPTGSTNSPTLTITRLYTYPGPAEEYTIAWAPGGQYFACAGNSSKIEILNSATGSVVFTLNDNFNLTDSVAWSPNGRYLASGHDDSIVRIWNATTGTLVSRLTGHKSHVNSVAWSPDNAMIVSGSGDKTARVWDVATGNSLVTYTGHAHYINSVAWAHFGTRVVSGSGDSTAQVWDAASGLQLVTYSLHSSDVLSLAWSPDDQRIASSSDDSTVQIWNSTNGTRYITYSGHRSFVVSVAWSPDGMKVVSGGGDHTKPVSDTSVQVWDPHTGNSLVTYHDHQSEVESVAWASDSSRIASASDDRTVRVWRVS